MKIEGIIDWIGMIMITLLVVAALTFLSLIFLVKNPYPPSNLERIKALSHDMHKNLEDVSMQFRAYQADVEAEYNALCETEEIIDSIETNLNRLEQKVHTQDDKLNQLTAKGEHP